MVKFGSIKRQHGRIVGLDPLLDRIKRDCPFVTRIVPGRIERKRGKTPPRFKIQYVTGKPAAGLKCIFSQAGSVQEVFLICSDTPAAEQWLIESGVAT